MEKKTKVIVSHQSQCDNSEIEKLISYLEEAGFEVQHGSFSEEDFAITIRDSDCYVCVLEQDTYKSKEVALEIVIAAKNGKQIFAIFCPSITLSINIPPGIDDFATGITEWNLPKLAKGLSGKDIGFSDQQGQSKKISRSTTTPPCK